MKSLIIYTTISLTGLLNLSNITPKTFVAQPVEIYWGRGFECKGRGICGITPTDVSTPSSIQLHLNNEGKPGYLEIPKSRLTELETKYHLSSDSIRIDKPFLISQSKSLEGNRNEILSGNYLIEANEYSYQIIISRDLLK